MSIRDRVSLCVSAFLYYSGLMRIIHWLHRRSGRRLLILNYHQASGGELRRHMLYLRKHFRLQFVDHALEELYAENRVSGKDRRLPLAITFDDGYLDNYTHAYALARELQIPITIFLISDYIGKGAAFWWFDHLVEKAQVNQATIDGHTYYLNKLDEQHELAQMIDMQVSIEADKVARRTYLCRMCKALSMPVASIAEIHEKSMPMLTWEQVQEMHASGWVAFGGHTLLHPTLAMLTNTDEACKEVVTCRSQVQEKLGRPVHVFAYPHGGIEHIGVNGVLAVQCAGYRWAVTTLQGVNTPRTPPYLIRRISANSQLHWLVIALMTSGVWDFLSYFHWLIKRMKHRKILKMMCLQWTP
jgi:peptidoglycan/xylan/chitin deacetylase (PgdA/CDA1 family)